ncbi:hypothetical protein LTR85_010377 [Meristemomyces frigidus]|nr:hypothetical protein LTR85_010377 [Meristemomyces frigidus]
MSYPVDAKELSLLQYPSLSPRSRHWRPLPHPIPMQYALEQLIRRLDSPPTAEQEAAAARIRTTEGSNITWQLLVKMFNDLDALVFGGDLYHRVYLCWVDMRLNVGGHGELGITQYPGDYNRTRIRICMSTDIDWHLFPRNYALGVLLHEMLHAYFNVWCRDDIYDPVEPGQNPDHGPMYTKAAKRIEKYTSMDLTSDPGSWMGPVASDLGTQPWPRGMPVEMGVPPFGSRFPLRQLGSRGATPPVNSFMGGLPYYL